MTTPDTNPAGPRSEHQEALLMRLLRSCFGELAEAPLALLRRHLQWVELPGGAVLMEEGEPGNALYIPVSGRLRAYVRDESGTPRMVREMSRGQVIGEMSLFTGAPRSATVVAIRETVLVRLDKAAFDRLVALDPAVTVAMTRQVIHRMQHRQDRSLLERPVTMGLVPVSAGVDIADVAARLAQALARHGRVCSLDAGDVEAALALHGMALVDGSAEVDRRLALLLDEIEAGHDFVLLVGSAECSPWTLRCTRHCDELLLVADAAAPPVLHATEQQLLLQRAPRSEVAEVLVLLHAGPDVPRVPQQASRWLARRAVTDHVHVQCGNDADFARLARLQSRTAVGLVFAGGGARGFAHLGVLRALTERGVAVDCVGGTSIGAVMAALVAADQPVERVTDIARRAFRSDPTRDFNPLPLMSLIKGARLRRVLAGAMHELLGDDVRIEDLKKGFYCVATNYSTACEEHLVSGPLGSALLASIAIPGALPPVVRNGALLCDGGTFNNFPVDVMRARRGIGTVVGVDLGSTKVRRIDFDEMPGWWALAVDRLRPRRRRRYKLPSLAAYLMNVTILYSASRRSAARAASDVTFNPPLERVGLLQWALFDSIVAQGYAHAVQVLDELDAGLLARLQGR